MSESLDEPRFVLGLDELSDRLAQVVRVLEEPGPQALLLQGPDEALGHPVALRLADVGGIVLEPSHQLISQAVSLWTKLRSASSFKPKVLRFSTGARSCFRSAFTTPPTKGRWSPTLAAVTTLGTR